jgi:hypothetical protein
MLKRMILLSLVLSGCAGLGFDKKATLMPDTVGMYYETGPMGSQREYDSIKVGLRSDWKFSAPILKEKKDVTTNSIGNSKTK